jgi:hypothetical protein
VDLSKLSIAEVKAIGFDQLMLAQHFKAQKAQCDTNVLAIRSELQIRARLEQAQATATAKAEDKPTGDPKPDSPGTPEAAESPPLPVVKDMTGL